jgi:23S rRNA pseudouridine2605 synthase
MIPSSPPEKPERLAKVIAAAGICSRRQAETLITEGKVSVNGNSVTTPAFTVTAQDTIEVQGKVIQQKLKTEIRLWCYYKPVGLLTTHSDPQERPTVFKALPPDLPRLISVGRLDINSEGLLLLTNDGELARLFELPSSGLRRQYRIRVRGKISPQQLYSLKKGITIDTIRYASIEAELENQQTSNAWISMVLHEGKNREIRRICKHFGWPVNRLIRTHYGLFELKNLQPGQLYEIPKKLIKKQLSLICESPPVS